MLDSPPATHQQQIGEVVNIVESVKNCVCKSVDEIS